MVWSWLTDPAVLVYRRAAYGHKRARVVTVEFFLFVREVAREFWEIQGTSRAASLAYATESMRLTTRLMQLASWLLLHRAVKEGEMSLAQASKEKTKVKLASTDTYDASNIELLPVTLRGLIERSQKLYAKVRRLDATMYSQSAVERQPTTANPVERQLGLLKAAFGTENV